MTQPQGRVEPGFERVRDAFGDNFGHHGDIGAACCVYRDGRCVVDLWGGVADVDTGRAWTEGTIVPTFSATKGVTAICVNRLAERGELDVDAPIVAYWPEFGVNGKQAITTRMVLSHTAGLAAVDGSFTLDQVLAVDPVVRAIAAQAPQWIPGTRHGYHARTFGWILGEIVRRVTGRTIGRYFAEEIAASLRLDYWIGLPEVEVTRCARLIFATPLALPQAMKPLSIRVLTGPSGLFAYNDMWNRPALLASEMPSSNGVGNARALARMYAATIGAVDGVRLLSPRTVAAAAQVQSSGPDEIIPIETCFGLGFSLPPMLAPSCGLKSFGHAGAGGALGFADPDAAIGFGYVMNSMRLDPTADPRVANLLTAVYAALG